MRIAITSGYFDPMHRGHLELLELSRAQGDVLWVIVNTDAQAALKKGKAFHALGFERCAIAREEGLVPIDMVAVVRHNRTLEQGNYRKAADEQGFFLRGFNYLLLFRKRAPSEKHEKHEKPEPASG